MNTYHFTLIDGSLRLIPCTASMPVDEAPMASEAPNSPRVPSSPAPVFASSLMRWVPSVEVEESRFIDDELLPPQTPEVQQHFPQVPSAPVKAPRSPMSEAKARRNLFHPANIQRNAEQARRNLFHPANIQRNAEQNRIYQSRAEEMEKAIMRRQLQLCEMRAKVLARRVVELERQIEDQ